jgi:hypothetical protein
MPSEFLVQLRERWNEIQARFLAYVEARGEVAVAGREDFPHTAASLKNAQLHLGGLPWNL